jgi:hypothetical protein
MARVVSILEASRRIVPEQTWKRSSNPNVGG